MGENGYGSNNIEITFSTRTLLRWADLTVRYQPLAQQGIQPVVYALDRALGFRASKDTRAMLHELVQRMFSLESMKDKVGYVGKITKQETADFSRKLIVQGLEGVIREAATNPARAI